MKYTLCFLVHFISFFTYAQSKLGVIDDVDGFVHIRVDTSSKSEIIGKIYEDEYFVYFEDTQSNWWPVISNNNILGYVHKSRITYLKDGFLVEGKETDINVSLDIKNFKLKNVDIQLFQLNPTNYNSYEFYCKALVRTLIDDKLADELMYDTIEAVGGSYGINFDKEQQLNDLFIAYKLGDYQGEIILVNLKGRISVFNGGSYFITQNGNYLVSNWNSDLGGLTIYDLHKKELVMIKELDFYISDWYVKDGVYYATTWNDYDEADNNYEIDFEKGRLLKTFLPSAEGEVVEIVYEECNCN